MCAWLLFLAPFLTYLPGFSSTHGSLPHLPCALQPHTQSLETLNLGHNPIGNEGVRNLKNGLISNRSVLRLGLASTKLTCEGRMRARRAGASGARQGGRPVARHGALGQPLRSPSQARWPWQSSSPRAPAS
jgi:hypothetical protein